jgi:hypothetical protein
VVLLAASLTGTLGRSSAQACSPGQPTSTALPRTGTTGVSTATSLVVILAGEPSGLALLAGGQSLPLSFPTSIGRGPGGTTVWQVHATTVGSMLASATEHVLSQTTAAGSTVELTRFTTAAGYDKAPSVAPVLHAVHLWRVRYPVADIASGNCVFAEYHGFITVDYDPATVPNTAAASVVYAFRLAPKNGGSEQRFVKAGDPFTGLAPEGEYPLPIGDWQPELDPTRQYCLSISAFGDGDLARLPVDSEQVCADVVQLSATGAPPPPTIDGDGVGAGTNVQASGGGCAVAGAASSAVVIWLVVIAMAVGLRPRARR